MRDAASSREVTSDEVRVIISKSDVPISMEMLTERGDQTHLHNDLEIDPHGFTTLVFAFEEEFDIDIPLEDFSEMKTVAGIVIYLNKRLNTT